MVKLGGWKSKEKLFGGEVIKLEKYMQFELSGKDPRSGYPYFHVLCTLWL